MFFFRLTKAHLFRVNIGILWILSISNKCFILYYILKWFYPVMAKLNSQQPLLLSSVSHDPSEIILLMLICCSGNFLLLLMLNTVVLLNVFVETNHFPPRILWWIESSEEPHLFEIRIFFCKIRNVFTLTFDQFNASLLNKCSFLFYFCLTGPNLLNSSALSDRKLLSEQ